MKITKLSMQQEQELEEYKDKWIKIGLNTDRIDLKNAIRIWNDFNLNILNYPQAPVVLLDSPLQAWLAVCMFNQQFSAYSQVNTKVRDQVINQVKDQVINQVMDPVNDQVNDQVSYQVSYQVREQVWDQVEKQVSNKVSVFVWPFLDGNFNASYMSFIDYIENCLKIKISSKFKYYKELTKLSLIYPLKNITIMSQKPIEIHMREGILHNENGMSIRYADGFGCYTLNGVPVPEWLVLTKKEAIKSMQILEEKNVEVRREILRKMGPELFIQNLQCKSIEKSGDGIYELYNVPIVNDIYANYIMMQNPSIDVKHFECVPVECDCIEKALAWRNNQWEIGTEFKSYERPILLT